MTSDNGRTQSYRKYERIKLTNEQERDMILRYGTTSDSISTIAKRFGVHDTYPYRILAKHNVDWRRDNGVTFAVWATQHQRSDLLVDAVPSAGESQIARDMRELASRAAAAQADVNRIVATTSVNARTIQPEPELRVDAAVPPPPPVEDLRPGWHVTFEPQSVLVHGNSIEEALAAARAKYPGLTIAGVTAAKWPKGD
jgi:transposase-like protein